MRYLDTNVFVYAALAPAQEPMAASSRRLLEQMAVGEFDAATASMTWDELVWAVKKKAGKEKARIEGGNFLRLPGLNILGTGERTVNIAQELIEKHGLDPRDCYACGMLHRERHR